VIEGLVTPAEIELQEALQHMLDVLYETCPDRVEKLIEETVKLYAKDGARIVNSN
jgi:hypothetical protein